MKEELLKYLNYTPYNTNPAIVKQILESKKYIAPVEFNTWADDAGAGSPTYYYITFDADVLQKFYDKNATIILSICGQYEQSGQNWNLADYCVFKNIKDNASVIKSDEELKEVFMPHREYRYIENPTLSFGVDENGKIVADDDGYYWTGPKIYSLYTLYETKKEVFAIY